jgi:hypothetical protein
MTDMMRANKLKADRIRADKIKAQDVVVTAKRSRRKRPSTREYIQPEPVYERTGIQRFNSVVDSPIYDPHTVAIPGRQNVYDAMPNRSQNDPYLFTIFDELNSGNGSVGRIAGWCSITGRV